MRARFALAILALLSAGHALAEERPKPEPAAPAASPGNSAAPDAAAPSPASEPWKTPEPSEDARPAYFAYLLQVIPGALEKSTCHCCAKTLARCFLDMPDPTVRGKCPFG